jgi:hypothetical protein
MKRTLFLAFIVWLSGITAKAQQRDSIFLYNGQLLIGEITDASLGVVEIDDVDLKMQKVKLYKIKRLTSIQSFKIETLVRNIYYGSLKAGSMEGKVQVSNGGPELGIIDISVLTSLDKKFLKRLNGSLSVGLNYTKSSSVGLVNLSSVVKYATRSFDFQLTVSENASLDTSKFSRDAENLQLFSTYNLNATYVLASAVQYQRNLELSISRRFQELLGAGGKVFVKKNWQLMALTGLAINQEKSTDGVNSQVLLEIPLMLRFNFYKFHHPNIQITTSQSAYISLSDKGRFRFDSSTDFSWQLVRYFYLTLNPYTNYDSKPPSGSTNFDFGLVMGISYKF